MVIYLSVIDMHETPGDQFVGAILVEIPIPVEDTHYSVAAVNCDREKEPLFKPFVGRLMSKDDVTAIDRAIEAGQFPESRAVIHAEPCKGSDLKPGELFSVRGPDYWNRFGSRDSVGESVYIRTHVPTENFPDGDADVFRITIRREPAQ